MLPPNPWELSWCLLGEHFRRGPVVGAPLPAPALLPRAQPFSAPSTGDLQGAGMGLGSHCHQTPLQDLKPRFGGRDEAGREKVNTPVPPSKILPILPCFFCMELPVSIIFKQIPGCPLTSRASFGSANTSRQFRRYLPLAGFPAAHSWLLPALVLWCTSIFLQAPTSRALLSYVRLCSFTNGKNSFPGRGGGWKTLNPSC